VGFDFKDKTSQYFILFILGAIWGSSFILMKLGLRSFTPVEVALLRISISFLVLSPFVIYHIRTIPKDKWKWLALAGIFGNGIPAFMFALGLSRINSSLAGIINSTSPLFTMIVGTLFFSISFKKESVWGIFIGLIGTVYLIVFGSTGKGDTDYLYVLFPLIGSICYGFSSNIIKLKLKELKPIVVTGGALMCMAPFTIAAVFIMEVPQKIISSPLNQESFLYVCVLATMSTSLAVLIFNYLIKQTTVLFASSVTYLVPMFAMAFGFIKGEALSLHYFLGMAIIVGGVWLTGKSTAK